MTSAPQSNDDRINLRLKRSAKLMLERAASLEGQTVSKFVLNCALTQAEEKIQEHEAMRLSTSDSQAFLMRWLSPLSSTPN